MDSRASLASLESTTQIKMRSRKRPLHTCAVSVLVIADKACTKVQGIHGPLGVMAKVAAKFATFASPIIIFMQYQWIIMAVLSFIDGRILAVENMIERFYPPSSIVFNKIDDFVQVAETLPEKLDEAMNKLPSSIHSIHQGSVLDWGLVRAITMLNFVSGTLTCWRMSKGAREKEIVVDTSCNDNNNHHHNTNEEAAAKANGAAEQLIDSSKHDANNKMKSNPSTPPLGAVMKGSYKEALTKGKKEGTESKKEGNKYKTNGIHSKTEEKYYNKEEVKSAAADVKNGGNGQGDILDLFDTAWLMNRRRSFEGKAPRSLSFHGGY
ncbi:uncharacterized protein LOC133708813 [Rosa rugosa]|uniref:uncharacterized protein LOC133708813 n=1 Tax=Rosa rugosa TaxID=74645 RepID=UPI002B401238|nr:uncharacterized protein LOC133708813 [Rosa rugosa]